MNSRGMLSVGAVAVLAFVSAASAQPYAMGTAFTYQGLLEENGDSVTDTCEFKFGLWDDPTATAPANQVGSAIVFDGLGGDPAPIDVDGGLFEVELDFGPGAIDGTARWLDMAVKCTGDPDYTTLTPRTELTPAPHALALPGLYTQQTSATPNLIGGYSGNLVTGGAIGATISGGGSAGFENRVGDNYSTVSGGRGNAASSLNCTVGGGRSNTATTTFGSAATVGGGQSNTASAQGSTISGGFLNFASSMGCTVSGGHFNAASGPYATVPGGTYNVAHGQYSFAAGQRANANHDGSFVWSDTTTIDPNYFTSTGVNQFLINAAGGVGIGKNNPSEQLDVEGNIRASGTIASGSSITIDGTSNTINSDGDLNLQTGGTSRVYLDNATGNVGIGTTSPQSALQVNNSSPGTFHRILRLGNYDTTNGNAAVVDFSSKDTANATMTFAAIKAEFPNHSASNQRGALHFYTRGLGGVASRMTIDADGKVGIGTSTPATVLEIGGDGDDSTDLIVNGRMRSTPETGGLFVGSNRFMGGYMSTIGFWTNSIWRLNVADNGNVGIGKITPLYPLHMGSGAHVTSGGAWTNASSEKLKENFAKVDPRDILDRVGAMPITSWNYEVEDDEVHHIGPTSESFHKAFGLGASDKHICTLDADGVALAAIQGLYEIVTEKECELETLRLENNSQIDLLRREKEAAIAELKAQNSKLEARLAAIEILMQQSGADVKGGAL